jgi:CheY-like chemotaxis protein
MKISRIVDKVLIVDDDPISNHLGVELLEKMEFASEVVVRQNGNEALHYLQSECYLDDTCPSLILLDLKMPVKDGFEFIREFNALHIRKNIEVVILTSSQNADDIIKLRNLGRFHLVSKPLTINKLVDIYHQFFRNSNT